MSSQPDFPPLNQNYNDDVLNTVTKLQTIENDLYKELENASIANNLEKQTELKGKISSISNTRIQLLNNLNDMHSISQNQVINNRSTLLNNLVSQGVISAELDNLKTNLDVLESSKNDKLKMVQINTYYAKRYKAHSELMKRVFIICTIILLIVILDKKGFLPNSIGPLGVIIVLVVGIIEIARKIYDLNRRDNLDFDRFKWNKPEKRVYDNNPMFPKFGGKKLLDTSICQLSEDIKEAAKDASDAVTKAALAASDNYRMGNTSTTEGFNILGKHSSPASYP